jgi:Tfp pilus assembly protein PilF
MKYKSRFLFCFLCVGLTALLSHSVLSQGIGDRNRPAGRGTYKIVGKVHLPDGKPAQGVDVTAGGAEMNGASAKTDMDGSFVLSGLSSGNYTVTVREKGYQTENELLTIPEGAISGSTFQLVFHMRLPGQAKQSAKPAKPVNPLLAGVPTAAVEKYEKAVVYISKEDAKSALPLLDEAIKLHPNFAAGYYEKGSAFLKLNEVDKALEAFVKAIELKPDYPEAKYGYGLAQFQKKNYEVAEAVFRDILKANNEFAEAHLNLGISLFHLKNPDAAESELKAAIAAKGGEKLALAHLYLGQIYIQKKRNPDAIAELEKYIGLAPKAPNAERIKSVIADLKKQS